MYDGIATGVFLVSDDLCLIYEPCLVLTEYFFPSESSYILLPVIFMHARTMEPSGLLPRYLG